MNERGHHAANSDHANRRVHDVKVDRNYRLQLVDCAISNMGSSKRRTSGILTSANPCDNRKTEAVTAGNRIERSTSITLAELSRLIRSIPATSQEGPQNRYAGNRAVNTRRLAVLLSASPIGAPDWLRYQYYGRLTLIQTTRLSLVKLPLYWATGAYSN